MELLVTADSACRAVGWTLTHGNGRWKLSDRVLQPGEVLILADSRLSWPDSLLIWEVPLALTASAVLAWFLLPGFGYALISNFERLRSGLYVLETEVDGTPVSYLEGGDGEVVVLLHGFAANKDHWTRVSKYLTPHLRVIAPDLPGFGDSGLVEGGDYSVAAQAARLHEFVRELGLTRFHLGGSSTGGNVAGAYAARYPETVKTLWLVDPSGLLGA